MTRVRPMSRSERAAMSDALHDMVRVGVDPRSLCLAGYVIGRRTIGRLVRTAKISAANVRAQS